MPVEEDDRPKKKISHEIGQDLSLLSVEELNERIALLFRHRRGRVLRPIVGKDALRQCRR